MMLTLPVFRTQTVLLPTCRYRDAKGRLLAEAAAAVNELLLKAAGDIAQVGGTGYATACLGGGESQKRGTQGHAWEGPGARMRNAGRQAALRVFR